MAEVDDAINDLLKSALFPDNNNPSVPVTAQPFPTTQPSGNPFSTQPSGNPFSTQPSGNPFPTQPFNGQFPTQPSGNPFPTQPFNGQFPTQPFNGQFPTQPFNGQYAPFSTLNAPIASNLNGTASALNDNFNFPAPTAPVFNVLPTQTQTTTVSPGEVNFSANPIGYEQGIPLYFVYVV